MQNDTVKKSRTYIYIYINPKKRRRSETKMTPPSLLVSESAAMQFLAANSIGSDAVMGCRFLNWKQCSFWLPISESATTP